MCTQMRDTGKTNIEAVIHTVLTAVTSSSLTDEESDTVN